MRTTAILFVVCSHALWVFPDTEGSFYSLLRLAGVMGVEIFFVLSGFLIGRILFRIFTNEHFKPSHLFYFLIRRWFRTLPNYYLILVLNIFVVLYLGRELPETLWMYFGFLQNTTFGMDIFFTESWSLPIEEFAYILGPILLYLLVLPKFRISRKTIFLFVTLFIILFFLATKFMYNHTHGATSLEFWNINLKAVVLYRIDAIYYGVLAAFISLSFPKSWNAFKSFFLFLSLFLFAGMHVIIGQVGMNSETTPLFLNVFYLPLCSIFIAFSLPVLSNIKSASAPILKPITFISIISYSMYLLHYSIILQLMHFILEMDENTMWYQLVFSIGYLIITIVLSYGLYRFYEKPLTDIRDKPFFKNLTARSKL